MALAPKITKLLENPIADGPGDVAKVSKDMLLNVTGTFAAETITFQFRLDDTFAWGTMTDVDGLTYSVNAPVATVPIKSLPRFAEMRAVATGVVGATDIVVAISEIE